MTCQGEHASRELRMGACGGAAPWRGICSPEWVERSGGKLHQARGNRAFRNARKPRENQGNACEILNRPTVDTSHR